MARTTTTTNESTIQFSHNNTRASRPWVSAVTDTDVDDDTDLPIPLSKTKNDVEASTSAVPWQKNS